MLLCLLVCASVHQEPHDSRSLQRSPRLPSHDIAFDEYAAMSLDSKDPHGRCAPAPGIIRKSSSFLRCGDGELGYVHVGKTGGTSVVQYLAATGLGFTEFHVGGAPSVADIKAHPRWLISVRDPIERLKSCFDWQNPDGGGASSALHPGEWTRQFYHKTGGCFRYFNEFAAALGSKNSTKGKCADLARYTLSIEAALPPPPLGDNDGSRHFAKGLKWYVSQAGRDTEGAVLQALLRSDFSLVRTEHIERDMPQVGKWLGVQSQLEHGRPGVEHGDSLSKELKGNLRSALSEEYAILKQLTEAVRNTGHWTLGGEATSGGEKEG